MTQHILLPESQLHEPKGASIANQGEVYIADGAGSGAWTSLESLVNTSGWGYYKDADVEQSFTTSPTKLSIDGLGTTTETSYLPNGVTALWDASTNIITPANIGDSYNVRLDLPITAVAGSASELTLSLDIGGTASPSIVIYELQIPITSGVNKTVSISFGMFALSTFTSNGGQIFLSTDANTAGITAPAIFIDRVSKGS